MVAPQAMLLIRRGFPIFLVLAAWCVSAGCSGDGNQSECGVCPIASICSVDGRCVPKPCNGQDDCPVGYDCAPAGFCALSGGCKIDDDCQGGRCVDGYCYPIECEGDQIRTCVTKCGEGVEHCVNGVWRGCDAPQPRQEVCGDNVDNNCDGQTDEGCSGCSVGDERACQTECGSGVEWCVDGKYQGCTAPQPLVEVCGDGRDNDCDTRTDEECGTCLTGSTRQCRTECGQGTERCVNGNWTGCDAPRAYQEVCNNRDDDCDGQSDENVMRSCANACGSAVEFCTAGTWGGCTARDDCACQDGQSDDQNCGRCGERARTCLAGAWEPWQECQEAGDCTPGEELTRPCGHCGVEVLWCDASCQYESYGICFGEGECEPGQEEQESCGLCGETRSRQCSDACTWSDWSVCTTNLQAECQPDETEHRDCEKCGTQTRTCGVDCRFSAWTECLDQGECEAGDEKAESCGTTACQARIAVCGQDCQWGDWGDCLGGGQCSPGQTASEACGLCGRRSHLCTDQCIWSDWSSCVGEGVCEPGDLSWEDCGACVQQQNCYVGICLPGWQDYLCNDLCQWESFGDCNWETPPQTEICGDGVDQDCSGADLTNPDEYETYDPPHCYNNNSCFCAHNLGEEPEYVEIFPRLDSVADDADYFKFYGKDESAEWFEDVKIWVDSIPANMDIDVCLYKGEPNCNTNSYLKCANNPGTANEYLEWNEDYGNPDDGWYYIKVIRKQGHDCYSNYHMKVWGLD